MAKKTSKKTSGKRKSPSTPANALAAKLEFLRTECGLTTVPAAKRGAGAGGFPEGRDQECRVEDATIKFNKNSDPMITWHLVGIGESNNNRHEFVNINLTADGRSFPYAKADVEAMGLSWESEIEACLTTLNANPDAEAVHIVDAEGLEVLCDVWMKGEFKNLAITGLLETSAGSPRSDSDDEYGMSESDDGDTSLTPADIDAMSEEDLEDLARSEMEIDPDEVDTYDELRKMLKKELCD